MARNYSSTAVDTTLSAGVTSTSSTLNVVAATGFPPPPFTVAILSEDSAVELALVTGVNGTALTVTRGYDTTPASAHDAGAVVRHSHAAIDFREAANHQDATAAHGASGAVMGTTNVQTVTNKNLTDPSNTFPTSITGYLIPTGAGLEWFTNTPPAGFLLQDGGEYLISSYTALYNKLTANGTVFPFGANTNGSGAAGSTHFRTPNRKGKFGVGYNSAETEFNAMGKTGGAKTHTLDATQIPNHQHTINHTHATALTGYVTADHTHWYDTGWTGGHSHTYDRASLTSNMAYGNSNTLGGHTLASTGGDGVHNHAGNTGGASANHQHYVDVPGFSGGSGFTGGGLAHPILNPYITINYIIKT